VRDRTQAVIDGINAASESEAASIKAGLGEVMWAISEVQAEKLGQLIAQQEAAKNSITGGLETSVFMAKAASFQVAALINIRDILAAGLSGQKLPGLWQMPQAATGMPFVPADMPVFVHKREAILTAEDAEMWRELRSGPGHALGGRRAGARTTSAAPAGRGGLTVNFHPGSIVIQGVADPEAAANLAVDKVGRKLRREWRHMLQETL
jgi:hypothetical protein